MASLNIWLPLRFFLILAVASILQDRAPFTILPSNSLRFLAHASNTHTTHPTAIAADHTTPTITPTTGAANALHRLLSAAKHYRTHISAANGHGGMLLEPRQIHRAMYLGDDERIRNFVQRMVAGERVTIALVGGSVSKGMGAVGNEPSFENWLQAWVNAVAPVNASDPTAATANVQPPRTQWGNGMAAASTVRIMNAACPATSSAYMNMCLREYIQDEEIDLVLLEYAINDVAYASPPWENEARKSFEQLIRKLLRLPRHPAVVLLNVYRWHAEFDMPGVTDRKATGLYTSNTEAEFFEFATFYGLPLISMKAATFHQMRAGVRGFQVHGFRYQERGNASADPEALFYDDPIHPSGLTGHRVISELVIGLLLSVARGLLHRPWRQSEWEVITAPLPPHLIPDNVDSQHDRCLLGDRLRSAVKENQGFTWLNEGRNPSAPKWGFTSTQPGAFITFALTSSNITTTAHTKASETLESSTVMVILAYLRSYEGMGLAVVTCEGSCTCGAGAKGNAVPNGGVVGGGAAAGVAAVLDGHWQERSSQLQLGCFPAQIAAGGACAVRVTVAAGSNSGGGHKVKLGGLITSDTAQDTAQTMCHENLEAARTAAGYFEGTR